MNQPDDPYTGPPVSPERAEELRKLQPGTKDPKYATYDAMAYRFPKGTQGVNWATNAPPGEEYAVPVALPRVVIHITLPFAALASDNAKYGVFRGKLLLKSSYRAKKLIVAQIANSQYKADLLVGPVELHTMLFEPDKRRRDVANYNKLLCDALVGVCYADDSQIDRVVNERGPIDRDNPRLAITLIPLWRPQ